MLLGGAGFVFSVVPSSSLLASPMNALLMADTTTEYFVPFFRLVSSLWCSMLVTLTYDDVDRPSDVTHHSTLYFIIVPWMSPCL